jgi:NADPH:quinone reductase-like Zn-dependent oxidoreductase
VRVRACGLNRADLGVAAGHMHGSTGGPGTIVGMEFAGEVVEVGAEVSAVKPGERVTFRTRSIEEVREISRRMRADLWGAIEAGTLRLPLDRSFPLAEAAAALAHMRANVHFGKIVLTV